MKEFTTDELKAEINGIVAELVELRQGIRGILHENGIGSNPCWTNQDIINGVKQLAGREEQVTPAPYPEMPEAAAKRIEANVWEGNFDEVIATIKELTRGDRFDEKGEWRPDANKWSWIFNTQCKYIGLRIDMRDGHFVLTNRNGERITVDQLKYQSGGWNAK